MVPLVLVRGAGVAHMPEGDRRIWIEEVILMDAEPLDADRIRRDGGEAEPAKSRSVRRPLCRLTMTILHRFGFARRLPGRNFVPHVRGSE
jgi:hypothetical protein